MDNNDSSREVTLTSVKDPEGTEIRDGGTTVATTLTFTGSAPTGKTVEIRDVATPKGTATANNDGIWTLTVSDLTPGIRQFKAVGQYSSYPESAVRTINISFPIAVAITSVKDPEGTEIPHRETTFATTVTLTGTAAENQTVEIKDGDTWKGVATARGIHWTLTLANLTVGKHAFTAVKRYDDQAKSPPYEITIEAAP